MFFSLKLATCVTLFPLPYFFLALPSFFDIYKASQPKKGCPWKEYRFEGTTAPIPKLKKKKKTDQNLL